LVAWPTDNVGGHTAATMVVGRGQWVWHGYVAGGSQWRKFLRKTCQNTCHLVSRSSEAFSRSDLLHHRYVPIKSACNNPTVYTRLSHSRAPLCCVVRNGHIRQINRSGCPAFRMGTPATESATRANTSSNVYITNHSDDKTFCYIIRSALRENITRRFQCLLS